ncbi:3'-5' exonuclease [Myxococcota bacterium]|nr:3'-5' exonuclease [Myxococcota bacterium]MBU1428924.1 3'-5' exonuclease [Myxococcota bacterium]MBU1898987.1 3'-5' exonuclease [Myxococcota bacterium]
MKLNLERPLVFFDLETTGLNVQEDRIIEIAVVKLLPDGRRETKTRRINPTIPISAASTEITGISDEDVKDAPKFAQLAESLRDWISGCDLAGYNIMRFDVPMLLEEFERAGVPFSLEGVRLIDAQRIFHKKEPRTLEAALRFYCDEALDNAHAAEADVNATIKVLEGQLTHYEDLPQDLDALARFCQDDRWVDLQGRLHWDGDEVVMGFGKKKGASLKGLIQRDPNYINWILDGRFPSDVKHIIREAREGRFPQRPQR